MDLRYSDDELAFRDELRAWLPEALASLPPEPERDDWEGRRSYDTTWQRMLYDAGYARFDWEPTKHLIFLEETERAGAPYVGTNFVGLLHAGPTIAAEGTPEQRERYLDPILRGDEVWCQGFSEPGAGSDLASLRTKAVREGDEYVVNGSKIWTSHAQVSDFCELLVRTDPTTASGAGQAGSPKHKGITWLVLPMDSPGVEVRPLTTIAGSDEFSEVFLTDVRIPVENRVGEENDGWRVAMVTFSFERGTAFVSELLQSRVLLGELAQIARKLGRFSDAGIRRELGHLAADFDALWALTKRNVTRASTGVPDPMGGSVFKLGYSEARHRMGDLALRILGRAGLSLGDLGDLGSGPHVRGWFHAMSITIAAGTSQIQRNILGERVLGLPKER